MTGLEAFFWLSLTAIFAIAFIVAINRSEKPTDLTGDELANADRRTIALRNRLIFHSRSE